MTEVGSVSKTRTWCCLVAFYPLLRRSVAPNLRVEGGWFWKVVHEALSMSPSIQLFVHALGIGIDRLVHEACQARLGVLADDGGRVDCFHPAVDSLIELEVHCPSDVDSDRLARALHALVSTYRAL